MATLMESTTLFKGNIALCQEDIYLCEKSQNQGWQDDKQHLARDKKKEHQNDITVGEDRIGVMVGKVAIPGRRREWMITS